jgi:hypothetical protein
MSSRANHGDGCIARPNHKELLCIQLGGWNWQKQGVSSYSD